MTPALGTPGFSDSSHRLSGVDRYKAPALAHPPPITPTGTYVPPTGTCVPHFNANLAVPSTPVDSPNARCMSPRSATTLGHVSPVVGSGRDLTLLQGCESAFRRVLGPAASRWGCPATRHVAGHWSGCWSARKLSTPPFQHVEGLWVPAAVGDDRAGHGSAEAKFGQ